jgi:hypothetical protein
MLDISDSKSLAYWQSLKGACSKLIQHFTWVWAQEKDLSKLLRSLFVLCFDTFLVDKFPLNKIKRKSKYLSIIKLSVTRMTLIIN